MHAPLHVVLSPSVILEGNNLRHNQEAAMVERQEYQVQGSRCKTLWTVKNLTLPKKEVWLLGGDL